MPLRSTLLLAILPATGLAIVAIAAWLWTPDRSRSELEAKYLSSPSDYLDVAGIRLHVVDSGPRDGTAIILLHGFGSSLHTWESWAEALSKNYRVIRYDLPGSGLTGPDPIGVYSQARGMEVLAALLDKLSIKQAVLVGNSMGGRLAWNFAAQYPQRVTKLVLISPDGFASPGFEYGKAPAVPAIVKLMKYALPKSMLRANLAPAYADPARLTAATVDRYYDMMLAPGVRGATIARMEQTRLEPPEPLLRRIESPTLLLWGEKDAMIPLSNSSDYLKSLAHAKLVTLPDLGHVPQEEAPAASLPPVQAFLEN
jgi:pimeloyl-ACP methyl ester carboxylesterase